MVLQEVRLVILQLANKSICRSSSNEMNEIYGFQKAGIAFNENLQSPGHCFLAGDNS